MGETIKEKTIFAPLSDIQLIMYTLSCILSSTHEPREHETPLEDELLLRARRGFKCH